MLLLFVTTPSQNIVIIFHFDWPKRLFHVFYFHFNTIVLFQKYPHEHKFRHNLYSFFTLHGFWLSHLVLQIYSPYFLFHWMILYQFISLHSPNPLFISLTELSLLISHSLFKFSIFIHRSTSKIRSVLFRTS